MNENFGKISDYLKQHEYFSPDVSGEEIFKNVSFGKLSWNVGAICLLAFVLIAKLFFLQVEQGFLNLKLAEGNRLKVLSSPAPRGMIYDNYGNQLIENEPSYQLAISSAVSKTISKLDQEIWKIIGMNLVEVEKIIKNNSVSTTEFIVLKENISREDALLYKSRLADYDGFEIRLTYKRKYFDANLSHVLGYIGKSTDEDIAQNQICLVNEYSGKSGLERIYDEYLQGAPGEKKAEVNVAGQILRIVSSEEPNIGNSVYTSIDRDLQNFATQVLGQKADELKTKAALVVMSPKSGEILAMVSYPYYDNTKISTGLTQSEYDSLLADQNQPFINRATSGEYPPGSSIKPFIALPALESGIVDPSVAFDTPAEIQIGQWVFPDWKDHGKTDIKRAISESNNIFFYALGGGWGPIKNGLGADGLKDGLEKSGFGFKTGVDIASESTGFIPTPEWKKRETGESWYIGNTYNMSIGQGDLLVTPIQIANATNAVASGGKLFKPHFVKKVVTSSGEIKRDFTSEDFIISNSIFSSEAINVVKEGMRMTLTEGSAHSVFGDNFPIAVAGKTGTAQFGTEEKTHAWFTSFAPYDDPQITMTILIEGGGEGYQVAAPIAKQIYQWWAENRNK